MASFSVVSNVSAINAQANLTVNNLGLQKALERLSSGFRINRSGDDAAGLVVANNYRSQQAVFYCFDLLNFEGIDLRKLTYADRRRYLAQCLLPSPLVQLVHASEDGVALHEAAMASGLEGVIGKRKDSRYESGKRSSAWLKVKADRTGDFVIVVNAEKVALTGKKETQKLYSHHSGYPGGLRRRSVRELRATFPERIIENAVRGMLPRNALGEKQFKKLRVYVGPDHPHATQQPEPLSLEPTPAV